MAVAASLTPAAAQRGTLSGRVMRGTSAQPLPVADQWVVLHRVDMESGAPLDSMRTDGGGHYRFGLTWDTTAIYFVGTEWQEIAYLTQPVHGREPSDTAETLMVWDTTRTGPPLTVAQRHIIVRRPDAQAGGRRVLELIVLQNQGHATRVGTGPSGPTWTARLPDGAFEFAMGESDMSAEAVREFEGYVQVMAPVPPGERQLLYTYKLPGGDRTLDLTMEQPASRVTILLEDTAATMTRGTLGNSGVETFEDATFRIFDGTVDSQREIRIEFSGRGPRFTERTLAMLLLLAALAAGMVLLGIRGRRSPAPAPADPGVLAARIAALDSAFEARAHPSQADRRRHRQERARLKAELDALLANRQRGGG